jgi:type I restriction enzyme S subunit
MSKKLEKNVPQLRFPEFGGQKCNSYKLSNIACVERGKFTARPRNSPEYYGGSTPFVQTGDIKNSGGRISSYSQTLNEKGLEVSKLFPKGSILLTIAANIGDVAVTEIDVACPDSIVVIQAGSNVVCEWLFYHLQTIKNVFESFATQNAQKNINLEVIRPIQISIPSIAEQEKIASFLGAVDTRLNQIRRKRELLQTYKRGVMQKLFSQEVRFKDAIGSEFPDWEEMTLGEICSLIKDGTHGTHQDDPDSNYYLLSAKNVLNGRVFYDDSDRKISESEFNFIYKNYNLKKNDLLLSIVGTIGRSAIFQGEHNIAFQPEMLNAKQNFTF